MGASLSSKTSGCVVTIEAQPEPIAIDTAKTAVIVVDMQNDFVSPHGSLHVKGAEKIVEPIARMIMEFEGDVVFTQDWHPARHRSFAAQWPGRKAFDVVALHGKDQVLWPAHCVQGGWGACIAPGLSTDRAAMILRKGMNPEVDSYSAFRENWDAGGRRTGTGLAGALRGVPPSRTGKPSGQGSASVMASCYGARGARTHGSWP